MLLVEESCMSDIFSSTSVPEDFYVYPVDGPSAMCLEVLQTDGTDEDGVRFHEFTPHEQQQRHLLQHHVQHSHHRPQHHQQQLPDSPSSQLDYGSRSPGSVSSDGSKPYKPQYTAELEVLCRICGDRASGFHYGVHSCEGCKGFFRRTLKKQLVYKPCQAGSRCKIDTGTRNKCQYCRYQRCLFAGMSQDAVRFGRMPKVEREKLLADREELTCTSTRRIVELRSLTDLIKAAFRDTFGNTIFFKRQESQQHQQQQQQQQQRPPPSHSAPPHSHFHHMSPQVAGFSPHHHHSAIASTPCPSPAPPSPGSAGFEDMHVGPPEAVDSLTSEQFFSLGIFKRFQHLTLPVMEASVRFAKKIPGFITLGMRDQIVLMKQNGFMVVHLGLYSIISPNHILLDTQDGMLRVRRNSYYICEQMTRLLGHTMVVMDRVQQFNLTIGELALLSAVLLTQDCPGLTCPQQVEELQRNLIEALRIELKHNHPKDRVLLAKVLLLIPDLRQIVDEFSENLRSHLFHPSPDFTDVMPLLKEIFDLDPQPSSSSSPPPFSSCPTSPSSSLTSSSSATPSLPTITPAITTTTTTTTSMSS